MTLSYSKNESFKLFNDIASRYDFINSVLSFGLHYQWRRLVKKTLPQRSDLKVLDIATGTGDVAFETSQVSSCSACAGFGYVIWDDREGAGKSRCARAW